MKKILVMMKMNLRYYTSDFRNVLVNGQLSAGRIPVIATMSSKIHQDLRPQKRQVTKSHGGPRKRRKLALTVSWDDAHDCAVTRLEEREIALCAEEYKLTMQYERLFSDKEDSR
jgi:hypothetical protein